MASRLYPQSAYYCSAFLRHKIYIISPELLEKNQIPYGKCTQEAGEFMVTFPYAYHAGYNLGFNCAEAINFAMKQWISFGKKAKLCVCTNSNFVELDMDIFTRYESGDLRYNEFSFYVNYTQYTQFSAWAQKNIDKIQNQTPTWINKIDPFEKFFEKHLLKIKELKDDAVYSNIFEGKLTNLKKLGKKSTKVGKEHVHIQRTASCSCNVIYSVCFPYNIDEQDVEGDQIKILARRKNWHQPNCPIINPIY
jgi:hypothetical protein